MPKEKQAEVKKQSGMVNNKILIWIIVIVVVLLILFFVFRGGKKGGEGGTATQPAGIDNIDVGENPDTGVDDFGILDVSQEDIFP